MAKLILVGGGARSGKSAWAEARILAEGGKPWYVATATAGDGEMERRIRRHRQARQDRFHTVEAPLLVPEAVAEIPGEDPVLIDCLTLWLTNLLLQDEEGAEAAMTGRVGALLEVSRRRSGMVIIVSNEVGLGLVPESSLGRLFRDINGLAQQQIAAAADEVWFGAMGLVVPMKGAGRV